jgi:hypothetical protein
MTMEPGAHRDALTGAIRVEGDGHRGLPAGDAGAAAVMLREAAQRRRASWELAPPRSFGRLIGMLKATVAAGDDGRSEAIRNREAPVTERTWRDRHGHHQSRHLPPARRPGRIPGFYRDTLGFGVRNDVGDGGMRWITVGPAERPGTSISGLPVRLQARQDTPGRCDPRPQE